MQRKNTAKVIQRLNKLVGVEAISAVRARELVLVYEKNQDIDEMIMALWMRFNPERVSDVIEIAEELEAMRAV